MNTQTLQQKLKERKIKIVSRSSALALAQTYEVIDLLCNVQELNLTKENFEVVPVSNAPGDQNLKDPLYAMGGIGVFTKIVEVELLNKNADIAVHSLKDLPTVTDDQLYIGAVPGLKPRGDVVIFNTKNQGKELKDLPKGSVIGTSSLRRISNLKHRFPDLSFENIRGNLNTRLAKLENGVYDAIILAEAGVFRLGWSEKIGQRLHEEDFMYAPGQGALGVQCRKDDEDVKQLLSYINVKESQVRVEAERQFLNKLEGGCKLPIAVHTQLQGDQLTITGQVWSLEADKTIRETISGNVSDADLGFKLSEKMKSVGAQAILEKVRQQVEEEAESKKKI